MDWRQPWRRVSGIVSGIEAIIRQDRRGGVLTVKAGGRTFTCKVTQDGKASFTNE